MSDTLYSILIGTSTGVIAGIIASLLVWWFLYRVLAPRITFSDRIRKSLNQNFGGGYKYQVAFTNTRPRDAVDLRFRALYVIPDFPSQYSITYEHINLSTNDVLELKPAGKKNFNKRLYFKFNDSNVITAFKRNHFPVIVRGMAENKSVVPETLFEIFPHSYIQITVTVTDAFTGAKKLFRSKKYSASDIVEGDYKRMSMDIIPVQSGSR